MRVVALDTHDGHHEGDEYDVPDHRARKLIEKGLVKAGPVPLNKMAPPSDNKANPSRAVGEERIASSSPAAPVLPMPIAGMLGSGGAEPILPLKRRGRPPKLRVE